MHEEITVCQDCLKYYGELVEMQWSRLFDEFVCPNCRSRGCAEVLIDENGEYIEEEEYAEA